MPANDSLLDALAAAIHARHGIDPRASATLGARFESAVSELAIGTDPARDATLVDAIAQRLRVGETRFFRDSDQLDALALDTIPTALTAGRCRVLSAGCSTGEEVYSLGMLVRDACGDRAIAWDVTGIDVSADSVVAARRARYPRVVAALVPERLRRFLVDRGPEVEVDPGVVSRCGFVLGDLLSSPLGGPYQIVVCRNVLIYLSEEAARRTIDRLATVLAPDGVLVVARAEVQLARRAGLAPVDIGRPAVVAFHRPKRRSMVPKSRRSLVPPPSSQRTPLGEPEPPSRARLLVRPGDDAQAIVTRGQEILKRGAALVEIHVGVGVDRTALARVAPALRRFVAAARAVQARIVPSSRTTAELLTSVGVDI